MKTDDFLARMDTVRFENRFAMMAWARVKAVVAKFPTVTATSIEAGPFTPTMKVHLKKLLAIPKTTSLLDQVATLPGMSIDSAKPIVAKMKTLTDLKKPEIFEQLPIITQTHILYPPKRITYTEIASIEKSLLALGAHAIVGSYRRRAKDSKDIDVMIIGEKEMLLEYETKLSALGKLHVYARGPDKFSAIMRVPTIKKWFRIDVFRCAKDEASAHLLYSTGSAQFNILMRSIAKSKGYLLNQRGLFKGQTLIKTTSEREIFEILGMKWREPHERM